MIPVVFKLYINKVLFMISDKSKTKKHGIQRKFQIGKSLVISLTHQTNENNHHISDSVQAFFHVDYDISNLVMWPVKSLPCLSVAKICFILTIICEQQTEE